jgi:hypothetical protein
MKGTTKIAVVLGIVVLVLGTVLFLGAKSSAHFDQVTLAKAGVVMDANIETAQFSTGDKLYRMWNEEEMIGTAKGVKQQILTDNMLFFEDDSILFTKTFLAVDTNGLTEKTKKRTIYERKDKGNYQAGNATIAENSIVKLATRMYFLNATAKVYFGEEEVTTVDRPLLLIDKTGSVIVYDVPTKKRYLGHLTLVIDEKKRFDVSDEKYYVEDRVIDLASFGGTDNKKLVLESSASSSESTNERQSGKENKEKALAAERNYSSEKAGATTDKQSADTSSEATAAGTDTGSANQVGNSSVSGTTNNSQGNGHAGSLITLKDYQKLLDKIDKLSKKSEKALPVLTLNYINPEVTKASYSYQILDIDRTLVGSPKVEIIKQMSDEVIETAHINQTAGIETFAGLTPNTTYFLRFIYQYDLGKGEGIKTLEVKSQPFETTKVEAVYQLKSVASESMVVKASLDQQMSDLSRVRLKVTGEDGTAFSIEGNTNLMSSGGQEFTISGLLPETKYHYQLELFLASGESLLLKESNRYQTLAGTKLHALHTNVTNNLIEVSYDWTSVDYQLQDASLKLVNSTTATVIPYRVVGQNEQELFVIPLIEGDYAAFSVQLNLAVLNMETKQTERLTYENDTVVSYRKNAHSTIRQKNADYLMSGTLSELKKLDLSEERQTAEATDATAVDNGLATSETATAETPVATEAAASPDNETYTCTLQWTTPAENEYTIVTERKEKQQIALTPEIFAEENWQAFDRQVVTVADNGLLQMELELSKLSVDTFDFRQAIYDNNGTLIMYVYSR